MAIVRMVRSVPEIEGAPTSIDVPDFDVEKLKKRGWTVSSESETKEKLVDEVKQNVSEVEKEPKRRNRNK